MRVRRQCATASVFAATLAKHPAVAYVDYPGLPTHPGHELARRTFDAGPEGVQVRRDRHRHPVRRPRGGARVRVQAAAGRRGDVARGHAHGGRRTSRRPRTGSSTTGRSARRGIDAGAVRFSIGLEDVEDLISDAYMALESLVG